MLGYKQSLYYWYMENSNATLRVASLLILSDYGTTRRVVLLTYDLLYELHHFLFRYYFFLKNVIIELIVNLIVNSFNKL